MSLSVIRGVSYIRLAMCVCVGGGVMTLSVIRGVSYIRLSMWGGGGGDFVSY